MAAEPGTTARVFATTRRAFALSPRLSARGAARDVDRLLTIATFAQPIGAAGTKPAGEVGAAVRAVLQPSGLVIGSTSPARPSPSASASPDNW